jgi:hypothetical protein
MEIPHTNMIRTATFRNIQSEENKYTHNNANQLTMAEFEDKA